MKALVPFFAGVLFAVGLGVSHMTEPSEIQRFLRFGGGWQPRLLVVMLTAASIFGWAYRRWPPAKPSWPSRIDARLLSGAALFGFGWGLSGLCPGPAIVNAVRGSGANALFLLATLLPTGLIELMRNLGTDGRRRQRDLFPWA